MRTGLKGLNEVRFSFTAVFVRYGHKPGWFGAERTLLFKNVTNVETNKIVADHVWFTGNKSFSKYFFKEGDLVSFCARVSTYVKGYVNNREYVDERTLDYRLTYPTKIVLVRQ